MNDNVAITSFYKGVKYSVQYNPRTWYNEYIKSLGKDIYGFIGTEQKEIDNKWIDTNDAIIFLRKKDNNDFEFLFGERYFSKANKTIEWYKNYYIYQGFIQDLSIKNLIVDNEEQEYYSIILTKNFAQKYIKTKKDNDIEIQIRKNNDIWISEVKYDLSLYDYEHIKTTPIKKYSNKIQKIIFDTFWFFLVSIKNDKEFVWKVKWDISIDKDIFTINEFSIQKILLSRNIQDERQMKSLIKNFTIYEYKNNHKWEYCNFFETPQEAIKCANLIVKNTNKK